MLFQILKLNFEIKKYKRWSWKEKFEILEQAKEFGVVETFRRFSVSTGNYYNWRKRFEQKEEAGLKTIYQEKTKNLVKLKRKTECSSSC